MNGRIPLELSSHLSSVEYEQTRVVTLFLGNLLRWSATTQPSGNCCLLCGQSFYSLHFLSCRQMVLPVRSSVPLLYQAMSQGNYSDFVRTIFLSMQTWSDQYPTRFYSSISVECIPSLILLKISTDHVALVCESGGTWEWLHENCLVLQLSVTMC